MGKLYPCGRCRTSEDIPTYQSVKFDGQVKYICGHCFEEYRRFVNTRIEPRKMAENADHILREWIPENQSVKDGVDNKLIMLTGDEWDAFRRWYFSGKKLDNGSAESI